MILLPRPLTGTLMILCVLFNLHVTGAVASLTVTETPQTITIREGDQAMLVYQKAILPPPEGKNPAFARSGFIHPIRSPKGGVMTSIHADDHIHHMGLWHAWVKTEHRDRHFDFWNLGDRTGKVRFVRTLSTFSHETSVGFSVLQQQVGITDEGSTEEIILEETLKVTVERQGDAYWIDYDTTQTNVTADPLVLPAYRYGGCIAYRAPYHWNKENSDYLTSEGKDRSNGHTTRGNCVPCLGLLTQEKQRSRFYVTRTIVMLPSACVFGPMAKSFSTMSPFRRPDGSSNQKNPAPCAIEWWSPMANLIQITSTHFGNNTHKNNPYH